MRKLTTLEFINRASKIHNNVYDYTKVKYTTSHNKVEIICKIHGAFFQESNDHLKGHGCPRCGTNQVSILLSSNKEEFSNKSNKIHNNFYNYSEVNYIKCNKNVKIICPKHGSFIQSPDSHLQGHGCPDCARKRTINSILFTNKKFISKASKIHNHKYDYSNSNYINSHTKIIIICPVHGNFLQLPYSHLNKHGCSKCADKITSKNLSLTTSEFKRRALKKHRNRYNYSNTKYINSSIKVNIICHKHGNFLQEPYNHLSGSGCPKCNASKGELRIEEWLQTHKINYICQKKFNNCRNPKNNYLLPFDFHIPNKNLLIEYDGNHHFKQSWIKKHKTTKKEFVARVYKDKLKNIYAKSNNINLLRIPYTEINRIEKILEKEIL